MSLIIGEKYHKLTVKALVVDGNANQRKYLCICDCGNEKVAGESNIKRGKTKSCGCLLKNNGGSKKRNIYLGSDSKLYRAWASMKSRCSNPNDPNYKRYGARGIKVCDDWMTYSNFKTWALANGYKEEANHLTDCSLDRIDNDGNYEPINCRWATAREQTNNTRRNTRVQYKGEEHTLAEWARIKGMSYTSFMSRYCRGWSFERIMETPKGNYRKEKLCPSF